MIFHWGWPWSCHWQFTILWHTYSWVNKAHVSYDWAREKRQTILTITGKMAAHSWYLFGFNPLFSCLKSGCFTDHCESNNVCINDASKQLVNETSERLEGHVLAKLALLKTVTYMTDVLVYVLYTDLQTYLSYTDYIKRRIHSVADKVHFNSAIF